MVSPQKSGRHRSSSGVTSPRAFFAFLMCFVWMSVTGNLRVLGNEPGEGSEEIVCCERPLLRGRRESGGGRCTGVRERGLSGMEARTDQGYQGCIAGSDVQSLGLLGGVGEAQW